MLKLLSVTMRVDVNRAGTLSRHLTLGPLDFGSGKIIDQARYLD